MDSDLASAAGLGAIFLCHAGYHVLRLLAAWRRGEAAWRAGQRIWQSALMAVSFLIFLMCYMPDDFLEFGATMWEYGLPRRLFGACGMAMSATEIVCFVSDALLTAARRRRGRSGNR